MRFQTLHKSEAELVVRYPDGSEEPASLEHLRSALYQKCLVILLRVEGDGQIMMDLTSKLVQEALAVGTDAVLRHKEKNHGA